MIDAKQIAIDDMKATLEKLERTLRAERKAQLETDGPYDDFEFEEELEYYEDDE